MNRSMYRTPLLFPLLFLLLLAFLSGTLARCVYCQVFAARQVCPSQPGDTAYQALRQLQCYCPRLSEWNAALAECFEIDEGAKGGCQRNPDESEDRLEVRHMCASWAATADASSRTRPTPTKNTGARNIKTQRNTAIMKATTSSSSSRTRTTEDGAYTASQDIYDRFRTIAPVSSSKASPEGTDTATSESAATISSDVAEDTVTATITAAPRASATSPPVSRKKKKPPVKVIVGSIVGGIFGILLLVILARILQRQWYKYQGRLQQHDGSVDINGFLAGGRKGPKATKVTRFRTPVEMAEERAAREGVTRFELA